MLSVALLMVSVSSAAMVPTSAFAMTRGTQEFAVTPARRAAIDRISFDPATLLALRPGDPLPSSFDRLGGEGLRLVRQQSVRDATHLLFEHPTEPAREASLLLRDGRLTGTIAEAGDTRTLLESFASGVSRLRISDATLDLPCGFSHEHHVASQPPAAEGGVAGEVFCDDGSTIDVFVAYTSAAQAQAGGPVQIEDAILWAIADSNAIYSSSGIPVSLRLVGTMMTRSVENGWMGDDLEQLQISGDGLFDDALNAGVAAGADLIAVTRADGGGACGIAYLIGSSVADVDFAVSVTALGCFPNKTFTHELGHNMGCCHAPGDGGGCLDGGVYPYSTGHRFEGQNGSLYRTVMAYAPGTRIGRFSSPNVLFEGTPTGIADERDNARTINETRLTIANFRCPPCPGDLDTNGLVDGSDLAILLGAWGPGSLGGDITGDGSTDGSDLAVLLGAWGSCS